jgi:drug/metabolite transporter (DMT)-like permease
MKKFLIYFGLSVSMILWAITFIWAKQVMNAGVTPTMLIFFRLISVSLFLFPIFLIAGSFRKIKRKDVPAFLLMALFEPFLYFIGEANGIKLVSPTIASIIIATIPLFLPFFARFFIKEKLSFINYVGIGVSFSGVLLIIIDKGWNISASPLGLMYLFIAVFSAVGYTLVAKKMLTRYSPMMVAGIKIFIALIYFIPVYFIFDAHQLHTVQFTPKILILILALGICGNLIAYFLFNTAIRNIGASKASIFSNLIPVFTAIFAFFLLQEVLPLIKIGGIGLAVCGIYISQIQGFGKKKQTS